MTDLSAFGHDPIWLVLVKAVGIFAFLLLTVLAAILIERKLLGRMQMRFGPNRVGPKGLLQSLVDGLKLGAQGRPHPGGRGQADLPAGADHLDCPGIHGVRRHPDGAGGFGIRPPHPAATDRPRGRGALHPRRHLDRGVRHRAGRLGVGLDLSAARRVAVVGPGDLLRDRDGVVVRRGVPLCGHDVHVRHRGRAGRHLVRVPAAAVVPGLRDVDGRRNQPRALRSARGRG